MRKPRVLAREDGFSLVELMIVVGIIGVLVGIALVSYEASVNLSKKAACRANLKIIREQLLNYCADHEDYPGSLGELVPNYIENERGIRCPATGEIYHYDPASGEVWCPYHQDL
ncbi:MAG: prepilin-type N-terminal cleavage/methylation domain-containing protein [Actinobacteria bacterium]|nr:prepilin-type N-terminal cleavage/methylation domain-containing protein [Actinomycetota bacterium]MDI6830095.1 prepilin-type N-terminal cleavage/methylation domain-containing protein [Actinomycetota bacterium]